MYCDTILTSFHTTNNFAEMLVANHNKNMQKPFFPVLFPANVRHFDITSHGNSFIVREDFSLLKSTFMFFLSAGPWREQGHPNSGGSTHRGIIFLAAFLDI